MGRFKGLFGDNSPCDSCGGTMKRHNKGCGQVAGQGGRERRSGGEVMCGYSWTYPAKPDKKGGHNHHTCGNPKSINSTDGMCDGPHLCVTGYCNETKSKLGVSYVDITLDATASAFLRRRGVNLTWPECWCRLGP